MAVKFDDLIWDYSDITDVEIEWQQFEAIVPIDNERELTSVKFSIINSSTVTGYFDDLEVLKNLLNDKLMGKNIIHMPIESIPDGTSLDRIVFGAIEVSTIVKVSYVPEENIAGNSGMQLSMKHTLSNNIICTKTYVNPTGSPRGIVADFGPVDSEYSDVLTSNSIKFSKSPEGYLPRGVLIIQWDVV
ncbi:hypothetical protein D3C79_669070 [compost metagenome]